MKISIYLTLFFLTLNSLYAQEVPNINSDEDINSSYEFSLNSLDVVEKDSVDSGVTVDLRGVSLNSTNKESGYEKFKVTVAHNFFKSASSLLEKANPMDSSALYAEMNFRF